MLLEPTSSPIKEKEKAASAKGKSESKVRLVTSVWSVRR